LTARHTIVTLVLAAIWIIATPKMLTEPIALFGLFGVFGLMVGAFIWPILGVHNLLVTEKTRRLVESNRRMETAITDLHQRVDAHNLQQMDDLNKTMASLEIEQTVFRRIPTWPWQPDTIRWVAAAFMLPLALWLAQWVLSRMLG
jgi:hypothetical protein